MRRNTNKICCFPDCTNKVEEVRQNGKVYLRKKCCKHRRTNPFYKKIYDWKRYGINITPKEYLKLLKKQNGVCAICGKTNKSKKDLAVDHNHETGKVRGLLCTWCNTHIEVIELWEWFKKAKMYLAN